MDAAKHARAWTAATNVQHNLYCQKVHTYFENKSIMFWRDANQVEWHMAGTYAKKEWIGFLAAVSALIGGSNNTASVAWVHLQYLLLDILKKGGEQSRKARVQAILRKRKQGT